MERKTEFLYRNKSVAFTDLYRLSIFLLGLTKMRFLHCDIEYEIPDEWLAEAEVESFVTNGRSYRAGPSPYPELSVEEVAVGEVEPLRRKGSHGVFNDNPNDGTAQARVVSILCGFRQDAFIPPIEVARLATGASSKYKLVHGTHRFYCSVAVGFSHVPAVEVTDIWGDPTSEA